MELVKVFERVRDIPYKIPLSTTEQDNSCSGKSERLLNSLRKDGYNVRYRVCEFLWDTLPLPKSILSVPHDKLCTHSWVEINLDGKWIILDATWDKKLGSVFVVNNWDGESNTQTAVKPTKIFTPEESSRIMKNDSTKEAIEADLNKNRKFYAAFNDWLEQLRDK